MLKRKAYDMLMAWKCRDHRPLLVKGQRQIGKTYIIERFGRDNYENVVFVNFVENESIKAAFDGDLDTDSILMALSMYLPDARFVPGNTLIVFDEIQDCPRARTSLKFFSIDGRFDVIATGS
ncbi:MAG: AAA family ATPase [Candidatus Methanomethylophilaceae archaeon]|nr:AAA family ATPase [Candidatus Methanomethylophilaceae archaeon]